MNSIAWHCPSCDSNRIVEVSTRCTVQTEIDGIDSDGELVRGPHVSVVLGSVDGYRCGNCFKHIENQGKLVRTSSSLLTVLRGKVAV